jgi:hypothetical protein
MSFEQTIPLNEGMSPIISALMASGGFINQILDSFRQRGVKTSKSTLNRFISRLGLRATTSIGINTYIIEGLLPWLEAHLLQNVPASGILYSLARDHELHISKSTLQRFLVRANLNTIDIPRQVLTDFLQFDQERQFSQCGYKLITARLRSVFGIPVKQKAVMEIMRELNPEANMRRRTQQISRFLIWLTVCNSNRTVNHVTKTYINAVRRF